MKLMSFLFWAPRRRIGCFVLGLSPLLLMGGSALSPTGPFDPVRDDPKLPRVLIIGDHVSIGYTSDVRMLLDGKANVHRAPVNAGATTRGLQSLDQWLGSSKWDVILFNWGLHDLQLMKDGRPTVALDDYKANLELLVWRLQETGAELIWATTTPIPTVKLATARRPGDAIRYNKIAQEVVGGKQVAVLDLHGFALPQLKEIQQPGSVYFSKEGFKVLAQPVAESIAEGLKRHQSKTGK